MDHRRVAVHPGVHGQLTAAPASRPSLSLSVMPSIGVVQRPTWDQSGVNDLPEAEVLADLPQRRLGGHVIPDLTRHMRHER
jgi:hypothetical protein